MNFLLPREKDGDIMYESDLCEGIRIDGHGHIKKDKPAREHIALTEHARLRLFERKIKISDIIRCIETREIIEQYNNDKPFPSGLILGEDTDGQLFHIVVSSDAESLFLITAYYPDANRWESGYKNRKETGK